jgi:hypothetical protein
MNSLEWIPTEPSKNRIEDLGTGVTGELLTSPQFASEYSQDSGETSRWWGGWGEYREVPSSR